MTVQVPLLLSVSVRLVAPPLVMLPRIVMLPAPLIASTLAPAVPPDAGPKTLLKVKVCEVLALVRVYVLPAMVVPSWRPQLKSWLFAAVSVSVIIPLSAKTSV